jgi:hypothetical protein
MFVQKKNQKRSWNECCVVVWKEDLVVVVWKISSGD